MTKKGLLLSLTTACSAIAVGATVFMSSSIAKTTVFANGNKTQYQYTLNDWHYSSHIGQFEYEDAVFCDGFIFKPSTGRQDIDLVVLIKSVNYQEVIPTVETLHFPEPENGYVELYSERQFYEDEDTHYHYEDYVNNVYAFYADKMIVLLCENFHTYYDEESFSTLASYDALYNFSNYSVSFGASFVYNYMAAPGASSEIHTETAHNDNYAVRTFTSTNYYVDVPDPEENHVGAYGMNKKVGMKVNISSISLSYSCEN